MKIGFVLNREFEDGHFEDMVDREIEVLEKETEYEGVKLYHDRYLMHPELFLDSEALFFHCKDYALAKELESKGQRVINDSTSVFTFDSKVLTELLFRELSIQHPKTIIEPNYFDLNNRISTEVYYNKLKLELGDNFLIKEEYGSSGKGIDEIKTYNDFKRVLTSTKYRVIFQEKIGKPPYKDYRLAFIEDTFIGGYSRENESNVVTSTFSGGHFVDSEIPDEIIQFGESIMKRLKSFGLTFAGLDILVDKSGSLLISEVNTNFNMAKIERRAGVSFEKKLFSRLLKE